jgi:hypothetical protein
MTVRAVEAISGAFGFMHLFCMHNSEMWNRKGYRWVIISCNEFEDCLKIDEM